jgi:putative ABC transport system permease protein
MRQFIFDLRFAARMFARRPTLTAAALATLALGIGANTAIFSVVDRALLAPPPFRDPDRIVMAWTTSAAAMRQNVVAEDKFSISWGDFYDWQRQARSFTQLAMFEPESMNLAGAGTAPMQLDAIRVTGDFSLLLGTPPLLGRGLAPGDDLPGKPAAILLSYAAWRRGFAADPRAIGRRVDLDGDPALVVGVMPPRFTFPRAADMPAGYGYPAEPDAWVPYCLSAAERQDHGRRTGQVIARLRPGVGIAAAGAELRALWRRLARQYPLFDQGFGVVLLPVADQMTASVRRRCWCSGRRSAWCC